MNLDEVVAAAESLRGANLQRYSIEEIEAKLKHLTADDHQVAMVVKSDPHIWYRGRSCRSMDGFANLYNCIYPPPECVDFNRANYPGEPTFYAAWNLFTVLNELGVRPGQFVHMIASRIRQGSAIIMTPPSTVWCHAIGDFEHFHNTGISMVHERILEQGYAERLRIDPKDVLLKRLYLDGFFAREFSDRVRKRPFEHMLTAAFAKMFFRRLGGILYPSVESPGAINLAIPSKLFDDRFEILWTEVAKVERVYGCGVYDLSTVRFSHEFADNGDINWDKQAPLSMTFSYQHGFIPTGPMKGWTVPK